MSRIMINTMMRTRPTLRHIRSAMLQSCVFVNFIQVHGLHYGCEVKASSDTDGEENGEKSEKETLPEMHVVEVYNWSNEQDESEADEDGEDGEDYGAFYTREEDDAEWKRVIAMEMSEIDLAILVCIHNGPALQPRFRSHKR